MAAVSNSERDEEEKYEEQKRKEEEEEEKRAWICLLKLDTDPKTHRRRRRRLEMWAIFFGNMPAALDNPPLPPIPPMVLQMLNSDCLEDQKCVDDSSKETDFDSPNWWRSVQLVTPVGTPIFAELRLRRLAWIAEGMFPVEVLFGKACRTLRHLTLRGSAPLAALPQQFRLQQLTALTLIEIREPLQLPVSDAFAPLTELVVDYTALTRAHVEFVAALPRLQRLKLRGTGVESLQALARCRKLRHVELRDEERLPSLSGLEEAQKLERVVVEGCTGLVAVSGLAAAEGAYYPVLRELSLIGCRSFRGDGLQGLEARVPTLTKLDLSRCSALGDIGFLAHSGSLVEVNVTDSRVTAADIALLLGRTPTPVVVHGAPAVDQLEPAAAIPPPEEVHNHSSDGAPKFLG